MILCNVYIKTNLSWKIQDSSRQRLVHQLSGRPILNNSSRHVQHLYRLSNNSNATAGSNKATDCTCNAGAQGPDAGPCTLCVAGKYKIDSGNALCADCLENHYSAAVGATSNVCQTCTANSQSLAGSGAQTSCKCIAGAQGFDGGLCLLCIAGKYKISSGDALCTNCLENQYSTEMGAVANVCQTCAANSQSPAGSGAQTSCICNAGAQGPDAGPCTLCIVGTYKIDSGDALCTICLANEYSAAVGAVANVCQTCAANSQSPAGSEVKRSCIYHAGWSGINREVRSICVVGTYRLDHFQTNWARACVSEKNEACHTEQSSFHCSTMT